MAIVKKADVHLLLRSRRRWRRRRSRERGLPDLRYARKYISLPPRTPYTRPSVRGVGELFSVAGAVRTGAK
jgi:hypothetical protein